MHHTRDLFARFFAEFSWELCMHSLNFASFGSKSLFCNLDNGFHKKMSSELMIEKTWDWRFSRRPIYKREIDAFLRRISVHLIFSLNLKWAVKGMVCQESSGKTFQFDFLQKTSCYSKLSIEWEKLTIEKCSAASCAKPDNLSSFSKENFQDFYFVPKNRGFMANFSNVKLNVK